MAAKIGANTGEQPRRFRWFATDGKHPTGRDAKWRYGVYFPQTDLMVSDMGQRGTGLPDCLDQWPGFEWLDK
jgi:hypothetical protein